MKHEKKEVKGLVVKDNALINASYDLEVSEQRLIMLAILNMRKHNINLSADSKIEIHARDYSERFNVTLDASYKALRGAVDNLFERQFSYIKEHEKTGKRGLVRSRWVSRVHYINDLALLEIMFAPDVIPLVSKLEQRFTSYQIEQVAGITSKYAMRLFEIVSAWKGVGKTPEIAIEELRQMLGLKESEYKKMHNFKTKVLDLSIGQINTNTNLKVKYDQIKKGRSIVGFIFGVKESKT